MKKNPKDGLLARKVGQALVKTHLFEKAITYYKAAIKTSGQNTLRYDLANLLFRMKRHKEAMDAIKAALDRIEIDGSDLTDLEWEARLTHLLAQVQLQVDTRDNAISTMQRAHVIHAKFVNICCVAKIGHLSNYAIFLSFPSLIRVMRRVPVEQPDCLPEQKQLAIK